MSDVVEVEPSVIVEPPPIVLVNPIVTVMVPSRNRLSMLSTCLQSFKNVATPGSYRILIRFDDDDGESLANIPNFESDAVKVLVGPHFTRLPLKYTSTTPYFMEMSEAATTPWIWFFNDDASIEGEDFYPALRDAPQSGISFEAENLRMGPNLYRGKGCFQFPIVINKFWHAINPHIWGPEDEWIRGICKMMNWRTCYLKNLTCVHDWQPLKKRK